MNGIVFAGCSFTHGHGLWQYSPYSDTPMDDTVASIRVPHRLFQETLRFPRLVASHFDTFEVVKNGFSGSDYDSIDFLTELFKHHDVPFSYKGTMSNEWFMYSDISYVIFQTSYVDRCPYIPTEFTKHNNTPIPSLSEIEELGFNTFDEYYSALCVKWYNEVREKIEFLESKNIKCLILSITDDYHSYIENDELLKDKLIYIKHDDIEFSSFLNLFKYDKSLMIINDFDYFGKITPSDYHPSKKCHKIVANSIIEKINKNEK